MDRSGFFDLCTSAVYCMSVAKCNLKKRLQNTVRVAIDKTMRVVIGTSGWLYHDWIGRFYPKDLKTAETLSYFTHQFKSVEINSTFYHLPKAESVQNWFKTAPEDFAFSVKLSRYCTHNKRLIIDDDGLKALQDFFDRTQYLQYKFAVLLVQLPPSMHENNERLELFLRSVAMLKDAYKLRCGVAIEFRHKSWFNAKTYTLLRSHNAALVINSSPKRWPESHELTADFAYIRFHGSKWLYRSSYTQHELQDWSDFIANLPASCKTVYAYFNNDYKANAVANARTLLEIVQNKQSV